MAITSKEINLGQLSKELGGVGLIADFNDKENKIILPAEGVEISEQELEEAIKKHIAGPTIDEVRYLSRKEGIEKLKELGFTDNQIDGLLNG